MNSPMRQNTGRAVGLSILIAIVLLSAGWIAMQAGKMESQANATPILPPLHDSPGLARFHPDAWYLPNEPLLGFVEIPEGNFLMGSDPRVDNTAFSNERWSAASFQGTLTLPTYYIARYEVTVAQFRAFVAATNYRVYAEALAAPADFPVTNVAWTDALAYLRWLTTTLKGSRLTPESIAKLLHDGWEFTLPNEAQWEKAARGSDGRIYPWGNAADRARANFGGLTLKAVGTMQCTDCIFGLADMSGNAWELTRSVHLAYPFNATQSGNLHADALYVMRGGSYADPENTVRSATRGGIDPGARRDFIGFRIVLARR